MTSLIDEVLARARLRDDFAYHYLPSPAPDPEGPEMAPGPLPATAGLADPTDPDRRSRHAAARAARRDLATLCETAIAQAGIDQLTEFLDASLVPEPESARTLGCYLQLGNAHDGARFWWQFAAGAGDHTVAYCLYLQHLSMEEAAPAAWWQAQTPDAAPPPATAEQPCSEDTSLPTTLRVLRQLKLHRPRHPPPPPPLQQDTIDYITHAVSFIDDDLELPLPEDTFTAHIQALSCRHAQLSRPAAPPPNRTASTPLPSRPPGKSAIRTAIQRATTHRRDTAVLSKLVNITRPLTRSRSLSRDLAHPSTTSPDGTPSDRRSGGRSSGRHYPPCGRDNDSGPRLVSSRHTTVESFHRCPSRRPCGIWHEFTPRTVIVPVCQRASRLGTLLLDSQDQIRRSAGFPATIRRSHATPVDRMAQEQLQR